MLAEQALHTTKRNPFYLLSALSMLLGCFALSRELALVPGQWKSLLVLIGVLQVYELLLLALALYLNRRTHARPDGVTLFFLGLVFLVDATHLNAELAASNPELARFVAPALLVLAWVKLGAVRSALGLTSRRALVVAMAALALILFLPASVRGLHFMGESSPAEALFLYGLWWIVGAIPLAWLWAEREDERSEHVAARAFVRAIHVFSLASIVLHLAALQWLYELAFHPSYATPLLLGMATYLSLRTEAPRLTRFWIPAGALLLSTNAADVLSFGRDPLVVTPLRLAFVGLALLWLFHLVLTRERIFGWAASASATLAASGHSAGAIGRNWASIVPDTAAEIGLFAVLAAFALLALGFAKSLRSLRASESIHRRGSPLSHR